MNEINNGGMPAYEETVDVDLATPGRRIAAYLLNVLFTVIAYIPFVIGMLPNAAYIRRAGGLENPEVLARTDLGGGWMMAGLAVMLVYGIAQCWMMSRHGQSFGKKIMKIRVLKADGRNPGFWGTVIVRELVFNIVIALAAAIIAYLVVFAVGGNVVSADILSNALTLLPWLVCLVMMFRKEKDRRTLQDLLADTVVVRLPG